MTQQTLPTDSEDKAESLCVACGLRPLTARLLISRGYETPEAVERFLAADLQREWVDPDRISGLSDVADVIEETIRSSGRILVFGDYDADGVTATATLMRGLKSLGADVCGLIPHRYDEGYALSDAAIERALTFEPDLIVTVDCGISCAPEVEDLKARGVRVVVTDHHEPGEQVPSGIELCDPKRDTESPSHDLAGSGVALKFICELGSRFGKPDLWRDYTDLVTLGTIGDLMLLVGENRALVADGVARIRNNPRPALDALLVASGVDSKDVSSDRLAYSLIPTINAAGRMGDATDALDLLLCDDAEESRLLAGELVEINQRRRKAEAELTKQVEERLETEFSGEEVIVVAGEGWHEGVKGITASRIARKYKRPTFIFTIEDGHARGSGRSYGNLNLFKAAST
ncbi:MAG: DHH family phosphoesterase, partial [Coriobacteriaceae bacterium]|nr:DHH family phosphoesterase [Coriobacteriaceae bacterium]